MSSGKSSLEPTETEGDTIKDDLGETTNCKEDYQIAICKDGKYAVTFDTVNVVVHINLC